jgi:hypothetical protein
VATVIIQPKYPNDPLPDVVADFGSAIADVLPGYDIETVVNAPHGHQVTPTEIISVWIPSLVGSVGGVLSIVNMIRDWLKKRHAEDGGVRPRMVDIYGADGFVIKSVSVARGMGSLPIVRDGQSSDLRRLPPK